jgi:signal transduction histidine kinase
VIAEIIARLDSLSDLMKDLLLFARPPQPRPARVEVHALVATISDLMRGDPDFAGVSVTVSGLSMAIKGDADLLKIVFTNLFINAAHAMQGRGTLRVSLGTVGSTSEIAFADTGPGIPADVLEKIVTPFFTTKARGSGLGLPTARRIIEAHMGTITVACPPSGGTIVSVQLPTA